MSKIYLLKFAVITLFILFQTFSFETKSAPRSKRNTSLQKTSDFNDCYFDVDVVNPAPNTIKNVTNPSCTNGISLNRIGQWFKKISNKIDDEVNGNKKSSPDSPEKMIKQKKSLSLSSTETNPEVLFALLEKTQMGKLLLEKFLPLYKSGEIKITHLSDDVRRANKYDDRVQAAFSYDGKNKTVYVDFNRPVGPLLMELSHELGHSVDDNSLNKFSDFAKLSEDERSKAIHQIKYDAETVAYTVENTFVEEMDTQVRCTKCQSKCYSQYLSTLIKKREIAPFNMSSGEIIKNYNLDCRYLNEGLCQ